MTKTHKAVVQVRLKDGVLDPQGVTIQKALAQIGFTDFLSVRSGKFFELEYDPATPDVERKLREVADRLLANPVIESFTVTKLP